jgi:hypothetical protein
MISHRGYQTLYNIFNRSHYVLLCKDRYLNDENEIQFFVFVCGQRRCWYEAAVHMKRLHTLNLDWTLRTTNVEKILIRHLSSSILTLLDIQGVPTRMTYRNSCYRYPRVLILNLRVGLLFLGFRRKVWKCLSLLQP